MKTILVLIAAAFCAAVGESFLSHGMKSMGEISLSSPSQWLNLVLVVVKNVYVTVGVAFLAAFFFLYLASLSWSDLSFALPLTNLSLVFAALIAKFVLHERVSWYRWAGILVILAGITLISLDPHQKTTAKGRVSGLPVVHSEEQSGEGPK